MIKECQIVLGEALRLSTRERAEIAAELLASLDGEADPDAEAAWAQVVERIARRALDGASTGSDWPTVRERVQRRLE